jgi:diguanylate cyclase (GGDEF)-like protein/PAS domain S-box-containing protein
MAKTFGSTRPRLLVLGLAAALFAAVFVLRVEVQDPQYGVGTLFLVPVVVVAIEYGFVAGLIAGALALGLVQAANVLSGDPVPLVSYPTKAVGYLLVGGLTGWMGDRMRRNSARLREGARHFELSGDMFCTADFDGHFLHVNDAWERTLGWNPEELTSRPFLHFVHPDDRAHTAAEAEHIADGSSTASFINRYRAKDGSYRWLEWNSRADLDACLIFAVARDVTDRRRAEASEREARERIRRIFDDSFAGIALVGLDGKILEANRPLAAFLGAKPEDLVGKRTLTEFAEDTELRRIQGGVDQVFTGESDTYRAELQVRRADGKMVWVDLTVSLIRDENGEPQYRLAQLLDVHARKEAERKLRHQADHDPLSGVYNRRRFEAELEAELAHESQHARSSAVLLFDVDRFKEINDTLGHAAGDAVIVRLAETLRNAVRTGDPVGRLGGDEFAILLRRVDIAGAEKIATKIRERARVALAEAMNKPTPISLSVGVAMIDGASKADADEILGRADASMYEAKRLGGDRVVSRVAPPAQGNAGGRLITAD